METNWAESIGSRQSISCAVKNALTEQAIFTLGLQSFIFANHINTTP
jgi:hypothetical protein